MSKMTTTSAWAPRINARIVSSDWAKYADEPFHTKLLVALMSEFRSYTFVVGFDGFFYDPEPGSHIVQEPACTLSLWAISRHADGAVSDQMLVHVYGFIKAWIAGWRAREGKS